MWQVLLLIAIPGDSKPTLRFAYGGSADFRGRDNTIFNILSTPNLALNMKTRDVETLLPRPTLLKSSFFTEAYVVIRMKQNFVRISMTAHHQGCELNIGPTNKKLSAWEEFKTENMIVQSRKRSLIIRANGWEMTFSRVPIEFVNKNKRSLWRYNVLIVPLSHTNNPLLNNVYGTANLTSPHGLLGQSFDKQACRREGEKTNYDASFVDQKEQAAGAIEGTWEDYIVRTKYGTKFKYSRFFSNNIVTHWKNCFPSLKKKLVAEINDDLGKKDYKRKVQ